MGNSMSLTRRQKKCLCRPSPASCIHAPCGMERKEKSILQKSSISNFDPVKQKINPLT